jgi:xanthine/CO dehydrogenase XdhC/CoxF family maturation factor
MNQTQDDILSEAARWLAEGRQVALATVVSTWGSSPRPVGSQLLIDDKNAMLGSVSGGCIEGAVVRETTAFASLRRAPQDEVVAASYTALMLRSPPKPLA